MSNLSDIFEVTNVALDGKVHKITIPDKTFGVVIMPVDVNVHFGLSAAAFAFDGSLNYTGAADSPSKIAILGVSAMPLSIQEKKDLGNRDFWVASLPADGAGSVTIIYEKLL